jgi:hypothetical protein
MDIFLSNVAITICVFGASISGCLYYYSKKNKLQKTVVSFLRDPKVYNKERKDYLTCQEKQKEGWNNKSDALYVSQRYEQQ